MGPDPDLELPRPGLELPAFHPLDRGTGTSGPDLELPVGCFGGKVPPPEPGLEHPGPGLGPDLGLPLELREYHLELPGPDLDPSVFHPGTGRVVGLSHP
ncbi:hypothetical protein GCM10007092_15450 [Thermus composti]|nr:hypothetical protein GCM10007092_15450 [Thermus composti]